MPREQINYPQMLVMHDDSNDPNVPSCSEVLKPPTLHVGWHPEPDGEGWVQVHLEADLRYFRICLENPNGREDDTSAIVSEVLTRAELNRLIKVLRRARDAAYGRDE